MKQRIAFVVVGALFFLQSAAQPGSLAMSSSKDSIAPLRLHDPRKATFRSAVLPGWGQAYNKKYWKIPLVYGALGTCAGFFFYNKNEYVAARDAYRYLSDNDTSNDNLVEERFKFIPLESIRVYRNSVRRNVDYSVLAFLICWGLNVVDATVDAHLLQFEVGPDLSLKITPGYDPMLKRGAVALSFNFGRNNSK